MWSKSLRRADKSGENILLRIAAILTLEVRSDLSFDLLARRAGSTACLKVGKLHVCFVFQQMTPTMNYTLWKNEHFTRYIYFTLTNKMDSDGVLVRNISS